MSRINRIALRRLQCALVFMSVFAASGCSGPVKPVEMNARQVLTTFYELTGGPRWHSNDNWGTDAPLDTWFGVTTDSEGNVTELRLANNYLSGRIRPELGMLESLEYLDFGSSQSHYRVLNGLIGPIPPELGNLRNLRFLGLRGHVWSNGLTGPIPPELITIHIR